MTGISASTAAYYNSLAGSGGGPDWVAGAVSAIKAAANPAGIMGALANSGKGGSLGSFLSSSKAFSANFATIAQSNVSNYGAYYAQLASQNEERRANELMKKTLQALQESQNKVKPKNLLPSFLPLGDGTSLDTDKGILTRIDGTQIDIKTGLEIIDPTDIIRMANGAYLNTRTNILTLGDGTKIDTVTGLKINTTA